MRLTAKALGRTAGPHSRDRGAPSRCGARDHLIDTADSYGPEVSERLIAEALHPYPPKLVIATKAGLERPGPGRWTPNGRPAHLRAACDGSLRRLKLERLDLYQLHRIDPEVPMEDQIGTLKQLQEDGKIRHIGLSEVGVAEIERARRIVPIASLQNRYTSWTGSPTWCSTTAAARGSRSFRGFRWRRGGSRALEAPLLGRRAARGDTRAGGARVAAAASPVHAPDPGDGERATSGRERRCGAASARGA